MPERFVSLLAERMRADGATVGVGEVLAAHRALDAVPPAGVYRDAFWSRLASTCARPSGSACTSRVSGIEISTAMSFDSKAGRATS